jgi:hypothetical protein
VRDPDETIQAIDEAVEGYVTWSGASADAAHWSAGWAERGAGREVAVIPATDFDQFAQTLTESLQRMARAYGQAIRGISGQFKRLADQTHPALAPRIYGTGYRKHRRTCRLCNPNAGPKPLPINGAEYARRRKARTRRNRR